MTMMRLLSLTMGVVLGGGAWLGSQSAHSAPQEPAPASTMATPAVTYTPLRRTPPPAVVPTPVAKSTPALPPPPAQPPAQALPSAPLAQTAPTGIVSPTATTSNDLRPPSALPLAAPPTVAPLSEPGTVQTTADRPSPKVSRKWFGIGTDVGVPDGINLALSCEPFRWARLSVAGGTNTASYGGRLGATILPLGEGPSVSVEGGKFSVSEPNVVVRKFFDVPSWVQPYVQQIGYRYLNVQLGYDLRLGDFVLYVHGGYSYIHGVVRSPDAVVVDSATGSKVTMKDDGVVRAYSWSAKAALIYQFGGV